MGATVMVPVADVACAAPVDCTETVLPVGDDEPVLGLGRALLADTGGPTVTCGAECSGASGPVLVACSDP